jgi:hypothetical protein
MQKRKNESRVIENIFFMRDARENFLMARMSDECCATARKFFKKIARFTRNPIDDLYALMQTANCAYQADSK